MIRQRTHRAQNIVAAIALLVIIALVLLGRRSNEDAREAAKDAGVDVAPIHSVAPKPTAHKPAPAKAGTTPSAAPAAVDASAPPAEPDVERDE